MASTPSRGARSRRSTATWRRAPSPSASAWGRPAAGPAPPPESGAGGWPPPALPGRPRAGEGAPRQWLGLAGLGAIVAMTVDVASGHAAAAQSGPIGLAAQWVHVVAAGLWIGGLLALLLASIGQPSAEKAAAIRR